MHQEILESMSMAVAFVDADRVIRYMNPAAGELLGVSVKRICGIDLASLMQAVDEQLQSHLLPQLLTVHDVLVQRADNKQLRLNVTVTPVDQPYKGWVIELIPRSRFDRVSQEEALWSQYEASSLLAKTLAHEIKNPLAGISGSAQLLARQLTSSRQQAFVDVIIKETTRLNGLLDRMLGGNHPLHWVTHNIHAVLEHVSHVVQGQLPDGVSLVKDYDPSLPELRMDFDRLVQVFLNLMRNGIQAMPEGGVLTLRTRIVHKMTIGHQLHPLVVMVEVLDTGVGIAPELLDAIFLPMITNKAEGTGLGLPIAQSMVHQHGGLILVESESGQTAFRVFLPVVQQEENIMPIFEGDME